MSITSVIERLTDNVIAFFVIGITGYGMIKGIEFPDVWYGFVGLVLAFYFQKSTK
jgi:hypothetical protein